ncbi:MAG: Two component system sensor histidine kinase MprB, partial [uncultured Nocardioidaceae bacterium]
GRARRQRGDAVPRDPRLPGGPARNRRRRALGGAHGGGGVPHRAPPALRRPRPLAARPGDLGRQHAGAGEPDPQRRPVLGARRRRRADRGARRGRRRHRHRVRRPGDRARRRGAGGRAWERGAVGADRRQRRHALPGLRGAGQRPGDRADPRAVAHADQRSAGPARVRAGGLRAARRRGCRARGLGGGAQRPAAGAAADGRGRGDRPDGGPAPHHGPRQRRDRPARRGVQRDARLGRGVPGPSAAARRGRRSRAPHAADVDAHQHRPARAGRRPRRARRVGAPGADGRRPVPDRRAHHAHRGPHRAGARGLPPRSARAGRPRRRRDPCARPGPAPGLRAGDPLRRLARAVAGHRRGVVVGAGGDQPARQRGQVEPGRWRRDGAAGRGDALRRGPRSRDRPRGPPPRVRAVLPVGRVPDDARLGTRAVDRADRHRAARRDRPRRRRPRRRGGVLAAAALRRAGAGGQRDRAGSALGGTGHGRGPAPL